MRLSDFDHNAVSFFQLTCRYLCEKLHVSSAFAYKLVWSGICCSWQGSRRTCSILLLYLTAIWFEVFYSLPRHWLFNIAEHYTELWPQDINWDQDWSNALTTSLHDPHISLFPYQSQPSIYSTFMQPQFSDGENSGNLKLLEQKSFSASQLTSTAVPLSWEP